MIRATLRVFLAEGGLSPAIQAYGAVAVMDAGVNARAAQFFPEHLSRYVLNANVTLHWQTGGPERFTYRRQLAGDRADHTEEVVELNDNPAFDPAMEVLPLAAVEPMVRKHFVRPVRTLYSTQSLGVS